ncbi:MAG: ATPase involved in replication initiation [Rhizobium sp.]|nr:ATPase involved in replication initiation [Rhizobium sp.]
MKDIVRMLRFLGNSGCRITVSPEAGRESACRLSHPGGGAQSFGLDIVEAAASRGLVLRRDGKLYGTMEARAFIRRYLAAREEAFLDQHRMIEIAEIVEADGVTHVRVNAAESPLGLLSRLKDKAGKPWFPGNALSAGERLARDFQFASLQPRITPSYEPRIGSPRGSTPGAGVEMKDSVVAARLRVSGAVEAMGPELSGVALDICCFEKGLEIVERERQWPARSAKLMLKTALLQLHRHYHPAPRPTRRSHAWGDEGFRPEMVV